MKNSHGTPPETLKPTMNNDDPNPDSEFHQQISPETINISKVKGQQLDPRLVTVLEFFRKIYTERREFFEKIFPNFHDDFGLLFKKFGKMDGKENVEVIQRSLSVGPLPIVAGKRGDETAAAAAAALKHERFKVKTVVVDDSVKNGGQGGDKNGGGK